MPIITNILEHIKSPIFFSIIMAFTSASNECTTWWNLFNCQRCLPKSLFILINTMKTVNASIVFNRISTKRLLILSGLVILHTSTQPANGSISALYWIFFPTKSSPRIFQESQMLIWSWLRSKKLIKTKRTIRSHVSFWQRKTIYCICIPAVIGFSECCAVIFQERISFR